MSADVIAWFAPFAVALIVIAVPLAAERSRRRGRKRRGGDR